MSELNRFNAYVNESGIDFAIKQMRQQVSVYRLAALALKKRWGKNHPFRKLWAQAAWDSRKLILEKHRSGF